MNIICCLGLQGGRGAAGPRAEPHGVGGQEAGPIIMPGKGLQVSHTLVKP